MMAFGYLKPVVLREQCVLLVSVGLFQCNRGLLVMDIGDPFEEQQREDVRLEVSCIDWST